MAGLLPTPKSSVLPLPFQLILRVCAPRSPPTLGWSPILPSKVGHRNPHGAVRNEKTAGVSIPTLLSPALDAGVGRRACVRAHSYVCLCTFVPLGEL